MKKSKNKKLFKILFLSIFSLMMIIESILGFSFDWIISEPYIYPDESTSSIFKITIDSKEVLPINGVYLELFGPEIINCTFNVLGNNQTECPNMKIKRITNNPLYLYEMTNRSGEYNGQIYDFGYGQGYYGGDSSQELVYNITFNSTDIFKGKYSTEVKLKIGDREFIKNNGEIPIIQTPKIGEMNYFLNCTYEDSNILLGAKNISGPIKDVFIEFNNYSDTLKASMISNPDYSYETKLNELNLIINKKFKYRFGIEDLRSNYFYWDWNNVSVFKRTELVIIPETEDGLNKWYISRPFFRLINEDSDDIYYMWDMGVNETQKYSGKFGMESIPDLEPNNSAGIFKLTYWSENSCGIETQISEIIKIDLTDPKIEDVYPIPESLIKINNPLISAYIDEIYQGNSGVNISSIEMYLDNKEVNPKLTESGKLDGIVSYQAKNLKNGNHSINLYVEDNSGRFTNYSWNFSVLKTEFNINVYSPLNENYNSKKILVNISLTEEANEISYIDLMEDNGKITRLCTNCKDYGYFNQRFKAFKEGENKILINAIDNDNRVVQENISFFVDSKKPKIIKVGPKTKLSEDLFEVEFIEENPLDIRLFYGSEERTINKKVKTSDCVKDENNKYSCSLFVNLSEFDGQEIEYYFLIKDLGENIEKSKVSKINVDLSYPKINEITYELNKKRVYFKINISEDYLDSVKYSYEDSEKSKNICRKFSRTSQLCEGTISLNEGMNNLTITAYDKLGNSDSKNISIFIDSIEPKILITEPIKGFSNGSFKVKFKEENPKELRIFYKNNGEIKNQRLIGSDCVNDEKENTECVSVLNLSYLENQEVIYWFELTDIVNQKKKSLERKIKIDTEKPVLDVNYEITNREVVFKVNVSEKNLKTIQYIDLNQQGAIFRNLCSRTNNGICEKKILFKEGQHRILIQAVDKSQMMDEEEIIFSI